MASKKIRKAIQAVVEYNWEDEQRDWIKYGGDNHIYMYLIQLNNYLEAEKRRKK